MGFVAAYGMQYGGSKSVKSAHPAAPTVGKHIATYAQYLQPFWNDAAIASYCDKQGVAFVSILGIGIGPATVLGRVGASGINSVDRVFRPRARPHVFGKRKKVILPALADADAKSAVSSIALVESVVAARLHAVPDVVEGVSAKAVGGTRFGPPASAGDGMPSAKIIRGNRGDIPASADAGTHYARSGARSTKQGNAALLEHRKSPEGLPNNVYSFHFASDGIIAHMPSYCNGHSLCRR